jgi:putative transposase
VRRGRSQHEVARQFGVSQPTVRYWVERARGSRLDRVDWEDQPPIPRTTQRTPVDIEDLILDLRRQLAEQSDLGHGGAEAIFATLLERGTTPLPSIRTIGRILQRRGALDGKRRVRRPPPPPGWYLPDVATRQAELDSIDIVEGLAIKDGPYLEILNAVSLHGGLVGSWPHEGAVTAAWAVEALIEHWRGVGLPSYAQFDNDTIFTGPHTHPDTIGRVMRLCLGLGVVPVFVPPRETGFQAMIEGYNGLWQAKVWARFTFTTPDEVRQHSARFVAAARARRSERIDTAPTRRAFPTPWRLDLQAHPRGRIIFVRRTDAVGEVRLLERSFAVDPRWANRLVRAEFDLGAGKIRFYALRRKEPTVQPMLREIDHRLPRRKFRE